MVFFADCGFAVASCYEEQSNSSYIATYQPENNSQQIHHSSNTAGSHFRLNQYKKNVQIYENEPTYCTELDIQDA